MNGRAVFLDRDGTVIEDVGYLKDPSGLKILPGAAEAIRLLNKQRLPVIIATNQSGVARGYFTELDLKRIHQRMREELAGKGAFVDAIYYCPHHPEGTEEKYKKICSCRKPSPQMLEQAALDFGLGLGKCYVVGDNHCDLELGSRAGCKPVLVLTGYGLQVLQEVNEKNVAFAPTSVAADLWAAVSWILHDISFADGNMISGKPSGNS